MSGVYHAFVASQSRLYVSAENVKPQEAIQAPVHARHLVQRETVYTPLDNFHFYHEGMKLSELLSQPPPPPPPSPADPPAVTGSSSLSTGNIFNMPFLSDPPTVAQVTSHAMDDSDDEGSDRLVIDEFSEEDDDEHRVDDVLHQVPPDEPEVQAQKQDQSELASRSSTNMHSSRGIPGSLRHRNQEMNRRARLLKNSIFKKRSRKTHCCRKCRVHGDEKPYKGHGNCPFKNCTCDGCKQVNKEREKSRANRRVLSRMEMLRKKYKTMADWYSRAK